MVADEVGGVLKDGIAHWHVVVVVNCEAKGWGEVGCSKGEKQMP